MRDYAFYHAGCEDQKGMGRLLVPVRRLLRYLQRPFFQRLEQHLQSLDGDIRAVKTDCDNIEANQLDREAVARRLAALEELVNRLLEEKDRTAATVALRKSA